MSLVRGARTSVSFNYTYLSVSFNSASWFAVLQTLPLTLPIPRLGSPILTHPRPLSFCLSSDQEKTPSAGPKTLRVMKAVALRATKIWMLTMWTRVCTLTHTHSFALHTVYVAGYLWFHTHINTVIHTHVRTHTTHLLSYF